MGNEERLSLLNRIAGIRKRNTARQAALAEQKRLGRRPGGYFPERGDISAGI
jgi:hypothetical protein